jgi:hypothetical protein
MTAPLRLIGIVMVMVGCGGIDDGDDGPLGGSLRVTGRVVDFIERVDVGGAASVSTSGLLPPPSIETQGATFTIDGVPENSAFHVLSQVAPTHRSTYSPAIEVLSGDVTGVEAPAVAETYLASLATAFGVVPTAGRGVLFARLAGELGPRAGIDAATLVVDGGAVIAGPFFLDVNLMPDPAATTTSASGWVVYFEVEPGVVGMTAVAGAQITLDMPVSPIGPGAVTVVDVDVVDGLPPRPTNVSFSQQVFPIFERRGCVACHSGNGPGRDLGNLTMNGSTNVVYRELVEEQPGRVVVADPPTSQVLTMPSREDPPDIHPNVTFTSPNDSDYVLIEVWIAEGALDN